jgi:hypothetical protein
MIKRSENAMRQWFHDSLEFLLWLGLLQLAKLLVVLFCVIEVIGVLSLWLFTALQWQNHHQSIYLLIPIATLLFVATQVSLWHFTWLRLAQRGGRWRALAEWFSEIVRYPVVRPPHPWE